MSHRSAVTVALVALLACVLSACCGGSTCIKEPPCKKADCGCAK